MVLFVTHFDGGSFFSGGGLEVSETSGLSLSLFDSDDSQFVSADAPEGTDSIDEGRFQVSLEEVVSLDV